MRLPAELSMMANNVLKALGKKRPEGVDKLFAAEWQLPRRTTAADLVAFNGAADYPDVVSVTVEGVTPTGEVIRVLIQGEGLREMPAGLAAFAGRKVVSELQST